MNHFLTLLQNHIENFGIKHWVRSAKKDEEFMSLLADNSLYPELDFVEQVYCLAYSFNPLCDLGKKKKYISISKGYAFCGRAGVCPCAAASVSKKCKENIDHEARLAKSHKTIQEKYGQKFPPQIVKGREEYQSTPQAALDRERSKATMVERYGYDNPWKSERETPAKIIKEKPIPLIEGAIQCAICSKETSQMTAAHLRTHGITMSEYKERFPDAPIVSKILNDKRITTLKKVAEQKGLTLRNKDKSPVSSDDCVVCFICGVKSKQITSAHLKMHGMSMLEYKEQFPESKLVNEKTKEKVSIVKTGVSRGEDFSRQQSEARRGFQPEHLVGIMSPEVAKSISLARMKNASLDAFSIMDDKDAFLTLIENSSIFEVAEKLNVSSSKIRNLAKSYGHVFEPKSSSYENSVYNHITLELGLAATRWRRDIIKPYELDIVTGNLAIEICGLYWHSDNYLDNMYHRDKLTKVLKVGGISLLTIFEDELYYKLPLVKSIITNKLGKSEIGVGARKLDIKNIDSATSRDFMDKHHMQGGAQSSVNIGAYDDNGLVGVMSFAKSWRNNGEIWELRRYAVDGKSYAGLASRLFSQFVKDENPSKVVSYADRRWSEGNLYSMMGFKQTNIVQPSYYYVDNLKRLDKSLFRKKKIMGLVPNGDQKTERQIMEELGYYRIYDCGHIRFDWTP